MLIQGKSPSADLRSLFDPEVDGIIQFIREMVDKVTKLNLKNTPVGTSTITC